MKIQSCRAIVSGGASGLGEATVRNIIANGGIIENPMLNDETIRLDGAIRMQPK